MIILAIENNVPKLVLYSGMVVNTLHNISFCFCIKEGNR